MPDIEGAELRGCGHISDHPLDPLGTLAQPGFRLAKSGLRDIEDGDSLERAVKEPIDQD
jgi:hypothetical protein